MNTEQLRKNVGQLLRLRPMPKLVQRWGAEVSVLTSEEPRYKKETVGTDYDWRLEKVEKNEVVLHCIHTDHRVTLGTDNVREYRTPHFLLLRCQLTLQGDEVRIEPI
ncbi:MAG TPA: hypothetical protein VJX92_19265 [Methylomirabilota bacterium]|nr:hypothetical protein [Methylomirabilota bacterium]